ncbi:DNA polymerase III subunit delta' [Corynebacterium glutamicum]|uniref:DNA polymerase III subunit delta' n=1 Tax=Corynebacterium glutamicum TaxID=1718 RepID=UPI000945728C|nr:DNA polymerase III subunit delta' [Corynebacterium glutamicum]OKX86033.1 DNA polymerase III subunit delta' [Corynebacterium glutamicum]QDX74578.1 DNA polymerase III subunit delta' [Corynebacterium glutamicum]QDX77340.1 DNA polymerase III subunit delta' [Corynebacterium glutamicum]TWS34534.1 DNA polymerase III subunit delta' [Corynebacterium glutamicum]TWS38088.1 DNA polymerase III subunit delta' [Corynebacterium glutamicum]
MTNSSVFDSLAGSKTVSKTLFDAASSARALVRARTTERARARAEHQNPAMIHDSGFAQSWLFTGPPGSGRSVAAKVFAATLVCSNADVVGCGQCEDCRAAMGGSHPDIEHIVPQQLSIGVDAAREVIKAAAVSPVAGNWRVVIFENADRLTMQAANALLKTVEEPTESTVMILCAPTTDPRDIAITLRSRCRHLYIPTPSIAEVARILVAEGNVSQADAELAAAASGAHIGRARYLAHNNAAQRRRASILNLAELIFHGDVAFRSVNTLVKMVETEAKDSNKEKEEAELEAVRISLGMGAKGKGVHKAVRGGAGDFKALEDQQKLRRTRFLRDSLDLALVDLAGIYRDAIIISSQAQVGLTHPDMEGLSQELATKVSQEGLLACLDAISKCRESFGFNVRPIVAMDALVGRLRKAYKVS